MPRVNKMRTDERMASDRLLIEIQKWDWSLHVGLSPASAPIEQRFQGGLLYTRGLDIEGQVVAPKTHRTKSIRIWISPLGPDIVFGLDELQDVGRLYYEADHLEGTDLVAKLFLPQDALENTITCLSSIWRYVHIWVGGDDTAPSPITDFSVSREIPKNLALTAA